MKMLTRTIRPARPDARRRSAFTLLELLVALAMVSILSVSLYQSLRIGFDAKSKAEAAVAPGRTSELAMELLRADIESTGPPNPSSTPSTTTTTACRP